MAQVAVITGAGSGIGRATAIMLAGRGYSLALVGRNQARLRETRDACTGPAQCIAADISDASACKSVISQTERVLGRIDVLINNAGLAPLLPIQETGPAIIDEVFGVNALGPAYLIHAAWPIFLRQKSGCIVNISTMGTIDPFRGFFAYAAAKAAVNLMAQSCHKEGQEYGIRAFAIAPGAVDTAMLRNIMPVSKLPASQTLSPSQVAAVILECVAGKRDAEAGKLITLEVGLGPTP